LPEFGQERSLMTTRELSFKSAVRGNAEIRPELAAA